MKTTNDVALQFADYFSNEILSPFAYLLFKKLNEGHICLHLGGLAEEMESLPFSCGNLGLEALKELEKDKLVASGDTRAPFILDKNRLYIQRYYCYETAIISRIRALIDRGQAAAEARKKILKQQGSFIRAYVRAVPGTTGGEPDWQLAATLLSVLNNFTIITGGPGTGKTTTVAKILSLLFSMKKELRVALAAPTGKAAMRMKESLENTTLQIPAELKKRFRELPASTIHRLLKKEKDTHYFRHRADNPLPFDVVIVDESSMIDVALFAKLLDAVSDSTQLILLGDKDQLASVEAGSLFGDLCRALPIINTLSEDKAGFINQFISEPSLQLGAATIVHPSGHPLFEQIIQLRYSYRSKDHPEIGKFSRAIIENNAVDLCSFFEENQQADVLLDTGYTERQFIDFIQGYEAYIAEADIKTALHKFNRLRVLCAIREGEQGLYALNKKIERYLQKKGLINPYKEFYEHRPLIVNRNHYSLKLFNGDVGIIRRDENGELKAWFEDGNGGVRPVFPGYLTECETVYAMTIHKSQGSEYAKVLVVLPDSGKVPILTRELLYTAVTRAKEQVMVQGKKDLVLYTAEREVKRASGIIERLKES